MAKASPIVRAFNAGEFSPFMEGRTDIDKYPVSMRAMENFIASPQGPLIRRSGTKFYTPIFDETTAAHLIPFAFDEDQSFVLEFTPGRIRFINDDGLVTFPPVALVSGAGSVANAPGLGAAVGDQVAFDGLMFSSNLNGVTARVLAVSGDNYTLDATILGFQAGATIARVYHVVTTFSAADIAALRYLASVDVIYLFTGRQPQRIDRYGATDWRLTMRTFIDGPFMDINATGTNMLLGGSNASGGGIATGPMALTAPGVVPQITVDTLTPNLISGYTFYALDQPPSGGAAYLATDYAPSSWDVLVSNDNVNFTQIDSVNDYVLYSSGRSEFFRLQLSQPYRYLKINMRAAKGNGATIQIKNMVVTLGADAPVDISVAITTRDGVNGGQGFIATDVGRLIRIQGPDSTYRTVTITAIQTAYQVSVKLQGEAFPAPFQTKGFRMGYWSDTTGWPTTGTFYNDRLWLAGVSGYPDLICGSYVGNYETFSQTDFDQTVTDAHAIVVRLNARKLGHIAWIQSDNRGLVIGTGSGEWTLGPGDTASALSPSNIMATNPVTRGAAKLESVKVDNSILFIQRERRSLRELSYVYAADGYQTKSVSQFASHLGARLFSQMEYAEEPHTIVWVRCDDGTLLGFTYDKEENVTGWHRHEIAGGFVESIVVIPSATALQDALWMQVRRTINGTTRRYIEKLMPFWDFGYDLVTDAFFVDCALRYVGDPITAVYGLAYLEGQTVYGLADGSPIVPQTVDSGAILLDAPASNIVLGLGYASRAETARLDAGAADGTAQGKEKRINRLVARLYDCGGGQLGRVATENAPEELVAIIDRRPQDSTTVAVPLVTTDYEIEFPEGYDKVGSMLIVQPPELPLPFNLIALMPTVNTQDR